MRNIERRLRKLEEKTSDPSGFRPHTPEWLAFYSDQVDRIIRGEHVHPCGTSIAVIDAIIAAGRSEAEAKEETL